MGPGAQHGGLKKGHQKFITQNLKSKIKNPELKSQNQVLRFVIRFRSHITHKFHAQIIFVI